MPDMISRWIARAAIVVSILDLEATFPALKRRCRVSEDRISRGKQQDSIHYRPMTAFMVFS